MTPKEQWLQYYINQGYYLIPIKDGTKQPLVNSSYGFINGAISATNNLYALLPFNSFAIVASNHTVIDLDLYKGIHPEIKQLVHYVKDLCPPLQITPKQGWHLFFQKTEPLQLNIPNVDVRNTNQYVLVCPSTDYVWYRPLPHVTQLPLFPTHLFPSAQYSPSATQSSVEPIKPTPEQFEQILEFLKRQPPAISGQGGHPTTIRVVTDLKCGFNLEDDLVRWLLINVYNPTCEPEWSERELEHKLQSIMFKGTYGYLWKRLIDSDAVQFGTRLSRAVKYCKNINEIDKIITCCRIGFMLDVEDTVTILRLKYPSFDIRNDTYYGAMLYNPLNPRNNDDGYLLATKSE